MCKPLFLSLNANPSASLQVNIAQGLVHMGKGLLTLNPLSFRPLLAVQVCPNYTLLYFATIDNDTY